MGDHVDPDFWNTLSNQLGIEGIPENDTNKHVHLSRPVMRDPAQLFAVRLSEFQTQPKTTGKLPSQVRDTSSESGRNPERIVRDQEEIHSVIKEVHRVLEQFPGKPDSKGAHLKSFFKLGLCQDCKRRQFVFQSYSYFAPSGQNNETSGVCSECLESLYGEDIYEVLSTRTHWQTPQSRGLGDSGLSRQSKTQSLLEFNSAQFRSLADKSVQFQANPVERVLGLHTIRKNLKTLLQIQKTTQLREIKAHQAEPKSSQDNTTAQGAQGTDNTETNQQTSFVGRILSKINELKLKHRESESEDDNQSEEPVTSGLGDFEKLRTQLDTLQTTKTEPSKLGKREPRG